MGGLRWWGISKYLARLGWKVTILAEGSPDATDAPAGVRVVRVPRARTMEDRYRTWRERTPPSGVPDIGLPQASVLGVSAESHNGDESLLRAVRREVAEVLSFPDLGRGWISRAVSAGRAIVAADDPDVILSSGPPHSTHVVARLLGASPRTRFFIDYRDPWRGQPTSRLGGLALRALERGLVGSAAGVLATTSELAVHLREWFPRTPVHVLHNGTDTESLPPRVTPEPGQFEVLHVGSLYGGRTPAPLLSAFERLVHDEPTLAKGARLRFIGAAEPAHQALLESAARGPLADHVLVDPVVPRRAALDALARASLAIVLASRQPELVPAKLYESVALGIPTLVITEAGSASAAAADRVGAWHRDPEDIPGIVALLTRLRRGELPATLNSSVLVSHAVLADVADGLLRRVR